MYVLVLLTSPMSINMPLLTVPPRSRAGPSWTRLWSGCSSTRESPASSWSTVRREDWWGTESWILAALTVIDTWRLVGEKVYPEYPWSWWGTINVFIYECFGQILLSFSFLHHFDFIILYRDQLYITWYLNANRGCCRSWSGDQDHTG